MKVFFPKSVPKKLASDNFFGILMMLGSLGPPGQVSLGQTLPTYNLQLLTLFPWQVLLF